MAWELDGDALNPQGKPLPDNTYVCEIEQAVVEEKENGTRVSVQYGSLRLPDGATEFQLADGTLFRIGNRKVFSRSWWEHSGLATSEQTQSIGRRELARLAIAVGLVEKPPKGAKFTMPFETAEELAAQLGGKSLKIRTKQQKRTRKLADGTKVEALDDEGQQIIDVNVNQWEAI